MLSELNHKLLEPHFVLGCLYVSLWIPCEKHRGNKFSFDLEFTPNIQKLNYVFYQCAPTHFVFLQNENF